MKSERKSQLDHILNKNPHIAFNPTNSSGKRGTICGPPKIAEENVQHLQPVAMLDNWNGMFNLSVSEGL